MVYLETDYGTIKESTMITMKDIVLEGHPALRKRAEKITFPLH